MINYLHRLSVVSTPLLFSPVFHFSLFSTWQQLKQHEQCGEPHAEYFNQLDSVYYVCLFVCLFVLLKIYSKINKQIIIIAKQYGYIVEP